MRLRNELRSRIPNRGRTGPSYFGETKYTGMWLSTYCQTFLPCLIPEVERTILAQIGQKSSKNHVFSSEIAQIR